MAGWGRNHRAISGLSLGPVFIMSPLLRDEADERREQKAGREQISHQDPYGRDNHCLSSAAHVSHLGSMQMVR